MEHHTQSDGLEPDVAPSGTGYRAIITRGSLVVWSCPHVHFTDHSARSCAQQNMAVVESPAGSGGAGG